MKKTLLLSYFISCFVSLAVAKKENVSVIIVKSGRSASAYSEEWKMALKSRMTKSKLDSLAAIKRDLTLSEVAWENLIRSKAASWKSMRDSLLIPFAGVQIPDTIFVMLGFLGDDDGFTFQLNTVCLDLSALVKNYGEASLPLNNNRIDRIFAHEFTHIIHKSWVKKYNLTINSFRDSILWECLYEGIGTYRSLSEKWLPRNRVLPDASRQALEQLYPIIREKLGIIQTKKIFTEEEKIQIQKNLSRGMINQKWGAFPVAMWLALEANGEDKNLIPWINKGPEAVILLAEKYIR